MIKLHSLKAMTNIETSVRVYVTPDFEGLSIIDILDNRKAYDALCDEWVVDIAIGDGEILLTLDIDPGSPAGDFWYWETGERIPLK